MSAHTTGPWHVSGAFNDEVVGNLRHGGMHGALQDRIATTRDCSNPEANARLIAAAPDMLAALKAFLVAYSDEARAKALDVAAEVIARVEGK